MTRTIIRFTVESRANTVHGGPKTVCTEDVLPEHAGKRYIELLAKYPNDKVKQSTVPLGAA